MDWECPSCKTWLAKSSLPPKQANVLWQRHLPHCPGRPIETGHKAKSESSFETSAPKPSRGTLAPTAMSKAQLQRRSAQNSKSGTANDAPKLAPKAQRRPSPGDLNRRVFTPDPAPLNPQKVAQSNALPKKISSADQQASLRTPTPPQTALIGPPAKRKPMGTDEQGMNSHESK
jgi:hypothetical protein